MTCLAPKAGSKFKEFTVIAGNGNDTVVNQTSTTSTLGAPMFANGGSGDDVLTGDAKADDVLLGAADNDVLRGIGGLNELQGNSGDDKLLGGSSRDTLRGGLGNDELDGGASDDTLDGGDGRDIIDGGPAGISINERHDRVLYSDRLGRVSVDLNRTDASQGTPADPSQGIPAEGDTIRDVEDINGGSGNDSLIGNAESNNINGGAGDDIISGRQGRDVLAGGDGNDILSPSPAPAIEIPVGAVPDGQPDLIECGNAGVSDGDPGDTAFRVVNDGDFANDCATVINQ